VVFDTENSQIGFGPLSTCKTTSAGNLLNMFGTTPPTANSGSAESIPNQSTKGNPSGSENNGADGASTGVIQTRLSLLLPLLSLLLSSMYL